MQLTVVAWSILVSTTHLSLFVKSSLLEASVVLVFSDLWSVVFERFTEGCRERENVMFCERGSFGFFSRPVLGFLVTRAVM